jgi:CobQ-like glutamine amidotransferase family enzyme
MNIYADRGNLVLLERRCAWRGIGFELSGAGLGEDVDPGAHDLFYIGGGQDRDQALCAEDLVATKRDALHAAADRGAVVLGVCGGYQLLGHSYEMGADHLPGVGLVDLKTVREDGQEGAVAGRVIGTYLHGPLLPKNPWIADTLIGWALAHRTGAAPRLEPLDDALERAAHAAAVARASRR